MYEVTLNLSLARALANIRLLAGIGNLFANFSETARHRLTQRKRKREGEKDRDVYRYEWYIGKKDGEGGRVVDFLRSSYCFVIGLVGCAWR